MYRIIYGSIFLIGSAIYYSYNRIHEERIRCKNLGKWVHFLIFTENHIRSFRTPLPEIVIAYNDQEKEFSGSPFAENGLEKQLQMMAMPSKALPVLHEYIRKAGSYYETEEIRLCAYTIEVLQKILEQEESELQNKTRLYRTLPLMFALSIVLLFL